MHLKSRFLVYSWFYWSYEREPRTGHAWSELLTFSMYSWLAMERRKRKEVPTERFKVRFPEWISMRLPMRYSRDRNKQRIEKPSSSPVSYIFSHATTRWMFDLYEFNQPLFLSLSLFPFSLFLYLSHSPYLFLFHSFT